MASSMLDFWMDANCFAMWGENTLVVDWTNATVADRDPEGGPFEEEEPPQKLGPTRDPDGGPLEEEEEEAQPKFE